MTAFEQFIFIYFISATSLAGTAVLWRNWLQDHPSWKDRLQKDLGIIAKALTCGSCFTFWITLIFVLIFDPLGVFLFQTMPMASIFPASYLIQWMALGWGAIFLRFLYIFLQESVSAMVHGGHGHGH